VQPDELDNEKKLLLLLKEGSEQAFEKLYRLYSKRLFGNLLKLVKSESLAREILQEIFMKVWDLRQQIDVERSFRSWLFKIAENKVYDCFRKAARDHKLRLILLAAATDSYEHIEAIIINKENNHLLQQAIESLPPQRKQVFRLCKLEGKSYEEVSRQLGISTSTISDHIVKASRAIRAFMATHHHIAAGILTISLFK
jgi:RNA polymerase sigma-70 factor (family 1)